MNTFKFNSMRPFARKPGIEMFINLLHFLINITFCMFSVDASNAAGKNPYKVNPRTYNKLIKQIGYQTYQVIIYFNSNPSCYSSIRTVFNGYSCHH